jgi:hypothetical protein
MTGRCDIRVTVARLDAARYNRQMKKFLFLSLATSLLCGCPPSGAPDGLDAATDASVIDSEVGTAPDEPIAPDVILPMDAQLDF